MKASIRTFLLTAAFLTTGGAALSAAADDRVKTVNGVVAGAGRQSSGVRSFKGIPYAQPPTGPRRWKPPADAVNWSGVRPAVDFGPRCMQHAVFGDMNFRSAGMSEDCLYLNVWTPAVKKGESLPVLVYFYGGGFIAGDGSEPRYDGESMAARGIVVVTLNYRLGVYGFLAHPELTRESPFKASGNYGLLDQAAALRWVGRNIDRFGGDPKKVTIAGESAGSASVSAQMASPLSKNLIRGAIGESGSVLSALPAVALADAEKEGEKFTAGLGAAMPLAALRALPAEKLQEATSKPWQWRFPLTVDGYFFPEPPAKIYAEARQSKVPLLIGWNSEEMNWRALLGPDEPTPENYEKAVRKIYAERAPEVLRLYPAATRDEVIAAATDLAGDRFIGYSTWKWFELHRRTGGPVYRYYYTRPRPPMRAEIGGAVPGLAGGVIRTPGAATPPPPPARGAVHSAEIEYAMGNLSGNKIYAWTADDEKVSSVMQAYFANFIKTGDPNGARLPNWPAAGAGGDIYVMRLDIESRAEPEQNRARYLFLDKF